MTEPFRIRIEQPKAITVSQQRDLLCAAVDRNPTSLLLKTRLAALQIISDQFDEAIALLEGCIESRPSLEVYELLAQAYLSRETATDNRSAREAARRAFENSMNNLERAAALASLGKAQIRLGEEMAAQATLERAGGNPHSKDAYKRLAAVLRRLTADDLPRLADHLGSSVGHSRLPPRARSRSPSWAHQGGPRLGISLYSSARSSIRPWVSQPRGVQHGNRRGIVAHPALKFDRYGTASSRPGAR